MGMKTILILGGGVSGLSAGIYARYHGFRAIVCERHGVAGGNLTGWQRGEYHIDNCIHWLTGTNPKTQTYQTWKALGALENIDAIQPESLYTCEKDGQTLSLWRNLNKLHKQMLAISPQDKKQIDKLIAAVNILQAFSGVTDRKFNPFSLPTLLPYLRSSTGELAKHFSHPLLQSFLSDFIGTEFSALALLFVFATFCGDNGGIPQGGSLQMAQRMAQRFIHLGGELLLNKQAEEIIYQKNTATAVRFLDGTTIAADYIVCAVDPFITFDKLLKLPMPKGLKKQYTDKRAICFSSWHCAFACDKKDLPFQGDFIIELTPTEREVLQAKRLIVREFSHQPSFAPKDKNILQTMVFVDGSAAKAFIRLKQTPHEYKQKKQALSAMAQAVLERRFPTLCNTLSCIDVWTPATYKRFTLSPTGAYMSFILRKNKLPIPLSPAIDELKNVVLATQWQQPPGGLPTAAEMGKRAVEYIARKDARTFALPIFRKKTTTRI